MKKLVVLTALITSSLLAWSQEYKLSGTINDSESGEPVAFVSVKDLTSGKGTTTDFDGNYALNLEKGSHDIEVRFFGYQTAVQSVDLSANQELDFKLVPEGVMLEQVEITGEKLDKNISAVEMSTNELDIEEVKKLPAFLGEVDVIKTIQLLPGVTTVGEGATGFNVRGGNIDQNLVLWDNATIYSSSHLFGFFSIFNSDAVDDLKLYKGGIPARYGGRLSSVLDVSQRQGNNEEIRGSGGIGVVSSRFTLDGPIKKDKATFLVSGRRSYADLFLRLSPDTTLNQNVAYFYDFNTRLDYDIDENDKLSVSGYLGRDVFRFGDLFGFDFGNGNVAVNWMHSFSDSTFLNTYLTYNSYKYTFSFPDFFDWTSLIQNYSLQGDLKKIVNDRHTIEYGGQVNYYRFRPASVEFQGALDEAFQDFDLDNEFAVESGFYFSDEFKVNDRFSLQAGLRYSQFAALGEVESVNYQEGVPLDEETAIDTTQFGPGEVVEFYHGLEPRLGIKYMVDSTSSVKLSYMRTRQHLHLVSNTTNGLPIDVWKVSDEFTRPAIADQIAVGYFRNFMDNMIETSVEVYYKEVTDILDYKNGADLLLNPTLETELLQGIGRAYGMELLVRKTKGDLTGWFAYTLSRTEIKVDGEDPSEKINNGDWYRANYDKPHDVTLVGSYEFTERFSIGANFTYSTGRPFTIPDAKYQIAGINVPNYLLRNQDRIPSYHRLDLSATIKNKLKKDRRWKSSWAFSIYNVYARRNPYSISFRDGDNGSLETVQLSILGTILPAVTYNFEF